MAKIIDEELLKEIASRKNPRGSVLEMTHEEMTQAAKEELRPKGDEVVEMLSDAGAFVQTKRSYQSDYERVFFRKGVIQGRSYVYINDETKMKITEIVKRIGLGEISVATYVNNILQHHLESYKEEINKVHKRKNAKNIL